MPPTAAAPPSAPGPPILPLPEMPTRPPAVSGSCRLLPAAVMALLPFDAGKPVVQVAVDGRLLHLQVDTGAETSVLTPPGAAALGISPGPARMRVAGLGGAAGYGSVSVPRIDFAGQVLRQMTLPVMRLEGADGLDGLIGADLLAPYEVEIDLPARRITLFRAYGCTHPAPRWRAEAALWMPGAALPILTGWLDGRPLRVLLDTGANVSSVDARMAGLPKAELNADPASRSYGAGGLSIAGHAHRLPGWTSAAFHSPSQTCG